MDSELGKAFPLFGSLMLHLNGKLSEERASPNVQKSYDQALRNLTKARSEYLTCKILHSELQEVLTDLEVHGRENTLSINEEKLRDVLSKTLAHAELYDYLHFSPSATSNSTLFDLTEADLDRHNPMKIHLPNLVQVVTPRVEEKLNQKCEELYAYFDASNSQAPISGALMTAKAHSLPTKVEERKRILAHEKHLLEDLRLRRDRQFWSYFQKLLECLSIMETLIKDFKCGSQAETDKITVQHMWALCKVTCLKLRSAQLRILCDTYTSETVKALRAVNGHLETATSHAKRELSATTQSLHAFRRLGPEFTALASQMAQLQQELQNKKWGLEQFDRPPEDQDKVREAASLPAGGSAGGGSTVTDVGEPSSNLVGAERLYSTDNVALHTSETSAASATLESKNAFVSISSAQSSQGNSNSISLQSDNMPVPKSVSKTSGDSPSVELSDTLGALSINDIHLSQSQQAKSQLAKKVTFQQVFDKDKS
ncbi:HAUS augmin-like complex subunit 4 [Plakobranchus ocellatus]|uniref:HAUS augmin-like complex subunit 4 n=1 Tax=Plakobranchus ocellatus TaxID=259542 RepID=A0AAV3ZB00_9GAST|nr:HAUS augmin-like complex subunit 4 [Plakobranchus ocellatus]